MSDPGNHKTLRKLAAILAADIASYSALMGADETATVRDLKAHQAVVLPMINEHGGRVIDTAGDGILAEFASVVNAVECAIVIQKTMAERNALVDEDRRMRFRIGVNLGDVIHDETRVYGDGVNVAARLENIAEPGGISISEDVYRQVHSKVSAQFVDTGEQQLKNISHGVRVYRVLAHGVPRTVGPALSLPEKPSIALLPFDNMSDASEDVYFADGIAEDIITELSRYPDLFVAARNSSFTYRGKAVLVTDVARELGVHYVLEGSVRRAGNKIRISAQLIEGTSGRHLWAQRYDRGWRMSSLCRMMSRKASSPSCRRGSRQRLWNEQAERPATRSTLTTVFYAGSTAITWKPHRPTGKPRLISITRSGSIHASHRHTHGRRVLSVRRGEENSGLGRPICSSKLCSWSNMQPASTITIASAIASCAALRS